MTDTVSVTHPLSPARRHVVAAVLSTESIVCSVTTHEVVTLQQRRETANFRSVSVWCFRRIVTCRQHRVARHSTSVDVRVRGVVRLVTAVLPRQVVVSVVGDEIVVEGTLVGAARVLTGRVESFLAGRTRVVGGDTAAGGRQWPGRVSGRHAPGRRHGHGRRGDCGPGEGRALVADRATGLTAHSHVDLEVDDDHDDEGQVEGAEGRVDDVADLLTEHTQRLPQRRRGLGTLPADERREADDDGQQPHDGDHGDDLTQRTLSCVRDACDGHVAVDTDDTQVEDGRRTQEDVGAEPEGAQHVAEHPVAHELVGEGQRHDEHA